MIQYPALLIPFLKMVLKSYRILRGDGNKWGMGGKHLFIFQQIAKTGSEVILQVIADHWFCVLPHYPGDIHRVKSPLLPEAHLLHGKLKSMTILSQWYLSYNCITGHVQHLVWRTRDEAGAMLWRDGYPSPRPFLKAPLSRLASDGRIPTASLEPRSEVFLSTPKLAPPGQPSLSGLFHY